MFKSSHKMDCNSKLTKGRRSQSSPLSFTPSSQFLNRDSWYRSSLRKTLHPSAYQSFNKTDFLSSKPPSQLFYKSSEPPTTLQQSEPSARTSVISYSGSVTGPVQKQTSLSSSSTPQRPISTSPLSSYSYCQQHTTPTLGRRHSLNIISGDVEMSESNNNLVKEMNRCTASPSLDTFNLLKRPGSTPTLSQTSNQNQNSNAKLCHTVPSRSTNSTPDIKDIQLPLKFHPQLSKKLSNPENHFYHIGQKAIISSQDIAMDSIINDSSSSFVGLNSVSSCSSSASSKPGKGQSSASIVHLPYDQFSPHSLHDMRSSTQIGILIYQNRY